MTDGLLIFIFIFLGAGCLLVLLIPLRKQIWLSTFIFLLMGLLLPAAYLHWGSFHLWQDHLHQKEKKKQIAQMMKSFKDPEQLVMKLKEKLRNEPESPKGWYLLGKLYSAQGKWQDAKKAFYKAHLLEKDNETYTVYYAQSLWQLNDRQFNKQIKNVFQQVLKKNPNQPDALAMLAMNAFLSHHYEEAILYWQRLLKLAPSQSKEADAIRKAIAKAQYLKEGNNNVKPGI